MNRYHQLLREWAPVAICASVLGWLLVIAGITACEFPIDIVTDAEIRIDFEIDDSDAGDPVVYVAHDSATASHGIWRVQQTRIAGEPGTDYQYECDATGVLLPFTPVRDLQIVTVEFVDAALGRETRFYALVSTPGSPALVVLRENGSQIARISLSFVPKSFDISSLTHKAYVVQENGPYVTRIDLETNTIDTTMAPMSGPTTAALHAATEIRVSEAQGADELWIGDGALGGVVIVNGNLALLDTIVLEAGATPHLDMSAEGGLVDALTDSDAAGLWEIDVFTRTPTLISSLVHGKTISSRESDHGVWFTALEVDAFASSVRGFTHVSASVDRSFAAGLTPASQLTVGSASFVALRDGAGNGSVACPGVDDLTPAAANPSAFARARWLVGMPPPPSAATYVLTINTTLGGTFTVTPDAEQGRYAEGTQVTVTAIPNGGFAAALAGFDSVSADGRIGTITMNADHTVAVRFELVPTSTTVTFSTLGVFRCTNGARLSGCNTPSITSRGTVVSFAPVANRSDLVDSQAPTVLGELLVSCPSGECGELNFNPAEFATRLEIVITQSAPFAGSGEFGGNGVFSGAIQLLGSTAQLTWAATETVAELAAGPAEPIIRYEIDPPSFAVPQSCSAPCAPLSPPRRLAITAILSVFN